MEKWIIRPRWGRMYSTGGFSINISPLRGQAVVMLIIAILMGLYVYSMHAGELVRRRRGRIYSSIGILETYDLFEVIRVLCTNF